MADEDEEDFETDDLAAEWGAALEESGDTDGNVASDWENMIGGDEDAAVGPGSADRVLNQEEIDNLLGFDPEDGLENEARGIRSLLNSALVSYERLPMLEIVFDRLVRLMTTSLRNFTSDNVEVSLDNITSIRFGDYLNSIPLPAILAVFKAKEWDNFGLFAIESNLIYSVVDVLLGGRRGTQHMRIEGRPYTTIELALVERMVEVIVKDLEAAFEPLSKVSMDLDRLETNPRFAAITKAQNAAILVRLRIDMEDRGGRVELLIPYATIEPIRELLLQMFMGERFGHDAIWEGHLATELWATTVRLDAVLDEMKLPLRDVMNFKVGQTLILDKAPNEPVELRCGNIKLSEGKLGRVEEDVAVRLAQGVDKNAAKAATLAKIGAEGLKKALSAPEPAAAAPAAPAPQAADKPAETGVAGALPEGETA